MIVRYKTDDGKCEEKEVKDVFIKVFPPTIIEKLRGEDLQRILRQMLVEDYYKPMLKHMASGESTSVALGKCPFPLECSDYENCNMYDCRCDSIDHQSGYTYRQS